LPQHERPATLGTSPGQSGDEFRHSESGITLDHADKRQFAKCIGHVHAIANDEVIRTFETNIFGIKTAFAAGAFVQQNSDVDMVCATRSYIRSRANLQRAAGFKNIIYQQHVATTHIAVDVFDNLDSLAFGPFDRSSKA
jgi:hypothetical protein